MSLVSKITKAIDRHNKKHPEMTVGEIYTAFSEILDALSAGLDTEREQAKREPTPVLRFFRRGERPEPAPPKLAPLKVVPLSFVCCENDETCLQPCPSHPHHKTVDSGGKVE